MKIISIGSVADIILQKKKSTVYLSGANAKWLDTNENSFFIKKVSEKLYQKRNFNLI